jgi:hypothetical protein
MAEGLSATTRPSDDVEITCGAMRLSRARKPARHHGCLLATRLISGNIRKGAACSEYAGAADYFGLGLAKCRRQIRAISDGERTEPNDVAAQFSAERFERRGLA